MLKDLKPSAQNPTFTVVAVYDPGFEEPWLLACPLKLSGTDFWGLYHDRWPIEQAPLASKHMVGAQRQFVSADKRAATACPELSLLAGSIQTYLAATLPPSLLASGIATPKAPRGDCAVGWVERLSQICHPLQIVEFEESLRLQTICPRVFTLTDAQNSLR